MIAGEMIHQGPTTPTMGGCVTVEPARAEPHRVARHGE